MRASTAARADSCDRHPGFAGDHELAETLQKAAEYLCYRARYAQAEPLYQRALRIGKRALGPEHPQMAHPLCRLATSSMSKGSTSRPNHCFTTRCGSENKCWGQTPRCSFHARTPGEALWKKGKYERAKPLYQRALHIRELANGAEHTEIAHLLNDLAILSVEQGQHEQAETLYHRALSMWERTLGANHPNTAMAFNNLADLYIQQGKYEQAEPLCEQALRICKQALGAEHPEVAYPLGHLAVLYTVQGKYEQAEPLFQRALTLREQHFGQHHPEIAQTLHDLALFCQKQGDLSEAISLSERAHAIRTQSLGDAHPQNSRHPSALHSARTRTGVY